MVGVRRQFMPHLRFLLASRFLPRPPCIPVSPIFWICAITVVCLLSRAVPPVSVVRILSNLCVLQDDPRVVTKLELKLMADLHQR